LIEHLPQEAGVVVPVGKIPTAAEHQGLVQRFLETSVPLLDVAVLVRLARLNLLRDQPIMIHQAVVTPRELLAVRQVIHRCAQPIGTVPPRHAAQLPQRVLQPLAETGKTLREADRRRLPVGVGQDEVVDHVVEQLALDRHTQVAHAREIRGRQPARFVDLAEEDFLVRSRAGTPTTNMPLQRPQLVVGEAPLVPALHFLEEGFGLQAGLLAQQGLDFGPDLRKRVGSGHPSMRRGQLAREPASLHIFAGCLLVHVRPQRAAAQGKAGGLEAEHHADLLVRDHRKPPCRKNLR
jgi:hypothetical protein